MGLQTELFLQLGARVVSIEPNPPLAAGIERRFGSRRLTVLPKAVGAKPGSAELHVGTEHVYSTISSDWVERVRASGSDRWAGTVPVEIITLDSLIDRYGLPQFVKIDVEGYELEVIRGLSHAVPTMSFEFLYLALDVARGCIAAMEQLASYEYNFAGPEQFWLRQDAWTDGASVIDNLEKFHQQSGAGHGDIYLRVPGNASHLHPAAQL